MGCSRAPALPDPELPAAGAIQKEETRIRRKRIAALTLLLAFLALLRIHAALADDDDERSIPVLNGRLITATFLARRPISAHFAAYTRPGQVPDSNRILFCRTSNVGEPLADRGHHPATLSIGPTGTNALLIPPQFVAASGQVSILGAWLRCPARRTPTAHFTGWSNPLGLFINNECLRRMPHGI